MVTCAWCSRESEVISSEEIEGHTGLYLSCGCRNVLCPSCGKLARDVSDTASEVTPQCDHCMSDDWIEFEDDKPSEKERKQSEKEQKQFRKKLRELPKSYSLDDMRKEYPRAYLKWTQDEIIASCFMHTQGKADKELVKIFERQPTVTSSRIGGNLNDFSESLVSELSAIRILGSDVICASCNHRLILTYGRLERTATALSINILALNIEALSEKVSNYKCPKCDERALKVPASPSSNKKLRGQRKQKLSHDPKPSKEVKEPWIYADRRNKTEYPEDTERSGKWLIFLKRNEADEMWLKIKAAIEEGKLGSAAKISTNHPASVRVNPNEQVVCVYTYDWTDEKDVMRIRQQLRELGVTWKISYKSDEDTENLKYRATGHKNIGKYRE